MLRKLGHQNRKEIAFGFELNKFSALPFISSCLFRTVQAYLIILSGEMASIGSVTAQVGVRLNTVNWTMPFRIENRDWMSLLKRQKSIGCADVYLLTSSISSLFWKLSWRSFSTCCSCSPLLQWCGKATRAWSSEIWLLSSLARSSDLIAFPQWPNSLLPSAFRYSN